MPTKQNYKTDAEDKTAEAKVLCISSVKMFENKLSNGMAIDRAH